jgi:head-tail adaptor
MKAGALRHRITVEQLTETQDPSTGAVSQAWTTFAADVPAAWIPAGGRELAAAASVSASFVGKWRIRRGNSVGITAAMRVSHDGNYYNLTSAPIPDESMRDWTLLPCEAGIRNG